MNAPVIVDAVSRKNMKMFRLMVILQIQLYAVENNGAVASTVPLSGYSRESLYKRLAALEERVSALETERQRSYDEKARYSKEERRLSHKINSDQVDVPRELIENAYEKTRSKRFDEASEDAQQPNERPTTNETGIQRHTRELRRPLRTVIHLDEIDTYSNEIPTEAATVANIEFEIQKINDKLRWTDFLLSRFQSVLRHLRGGANYQVVDDSDDGMSGDDGEYFYTIDGSMLGSGDDSDRSVNGLYDRFTQLKATVETIVNGVYNINPSGPSGQTTDGEDQSELMRRVQELEAKSDRDEELRIKDKKHQVARIVSLEGDLNKTKMFVDKWMMVSEAMKRSHMSIFTALTEQMARYNSLQSKLVKLELKAAHLQVELMNVTHNGALSSASCDVTETAVRFKIDIDKMRKAFDSQRHEVDTLTEEVKRKADEHSFKDMRATVMATNEKIEKLDADLKSVIAKLDENRNSISNLESSLPRACSDSLSTYGIYKDYLLIKPSDKLPSLMVHCDGNWTVIQQRTDGAVPFNRTFEQYRWPFGQAQQDHWIGNEYIHALTQPSGCSIRFETWDLFGEYRVALYHSFSISDFASLYRLSISDYDKDESNLTDAMSFHNGRRFSSMDRDEDSSSTHCARYYAAGWWFANCAKSNLNGNFHLGILWFDMHGGDWIHLGRTRISISTITDDNFTNVHSRLARTVKIA